VFPESLADQNHTSVSKVYTRFQYFCTLPNLRTVSNEDSKNTWSLHGPFDKSANLCSLSDFPFVKNQSFTNETSVVLLVLGWTSQRQKVAQYIRQEVKRSKLQPFHWSSAEQTIWRDEDLLKIVCHRDLQHEHLKLLTLPPWYHWLQKNHRLPHKSNLGGGFNPCETY